MPTFFDSTGEPPAMSLPALLSDAASYTERLLVLAVVPFVTALLNWNDVTAAAAAGDQYGVTFGTPIPIVDLWSFVDAPTSQGAGQVPVGDPVVVAGSVLVVVAFAAVFVVFQGLLLAGYLGSIRDGVERSVGEFDFVANVSRYASQMIGFQLLVVGLVVATIAVLLVAPALFPLAVLGIFVLAYLFFPTPYLVVIDDAPLADALDWSLELTTGVRGPPVFFLAYLLLSAVISLPLTAVALNGGLAGVLVAATFAAPVGLWLTIFTYLFVASLVDPGRGVDGPLWN